MEILTPDRILTLLGFMALLGLVWLAVRLKAAPLTARIGAGRRMQLQEVLPLGDGSRAILMQAQGETLLVVTSRKGPAHVVALAAVAETARPEHTA